MIHRDHQHHRPSVGLNDLETYSQIV